MNAVMVCTNHSAHSFGLGCKARVPKQSAHVKRSVVRINIQPHQAIACVAQGRTEKVLVLREECNATLLMQQWNDVRVFDSVAGDVTSDLPKGDVPLFEQRQLVFRKIFVEKIQATSAGPFRVRRRD